MSFETSLTIALTALAIDALIGWPDALFRRIGHPVVWLAQLISALDRRWNRGRHRIAKGGLAVLVTVGAAVLPALVLTAVLAPLPGGAVLLGVLAWPLVAARSMYDHVAAVARPLGAGDLPGARAAAAMIVGRDLGDSPAPIARATLESLGENTSDGIIAPLVWAALLGLPGIAAYKAINTLDSMIGHRNERFELFGKAAARLDDLVNLPASRLTGALFVLAAPTRATRARAARVMWRDAGFHRSPNAGWPEAALAGALGVRLSGPRSYGGQITQEPWLNETAPDPGAADLARGLVLYRRALMLMAALMLGLWLT